MNNLGNKEIMAANIKRFMDQNNKSRVDVCNALNIAYTTFTDWINAKTYPRIDKIEQLANYFGIEKADLVEPKESRILPSLFNIPLYSSISCGTGLFVDDEVEDFIAIPDRFLKKGKEYFANTADGDSMIGKGIKEGDVIVFEKTNLLENGDIGAFCVGESEAICKIFRKLPNGLIMLESANDKYEPIIVDITEECFRIIGKYKFKFSVEQ